MAGLTARSDDAPPPLGYAIAQLPNRATVTARGYVHVHHVSDTVSNDTVYLLP